MHKYTIRENYIYYASNIAELNHAAPTNATGVRHAILPNGRRGRRLYVLELLDPNDVIRGSKPAKNPPYGR